MLGVEGLTPVTFIIVVIASCGISLIFSIFGRGGGEFKLPFFVTFLTMLPFFDLATISLFGILLQGITMLAIYGGKHKLVDWPLAFALSAVVAPAAFLGGYISIGIEAIYLKLAFAAMLVVAAVLMLKGKTVSIKTGGFGVWHRKNPTGVEYDMNLLLILIPVGIVAFVAGMVGISGGALIIPICSILGGVPLSVAIGTNTLLILISSGTAFVGHVIRGTTPWALAIILAAAGVVGAFIGSNLHIGLKDRFIKFGFIVLLLAAAIWMIAKTYLF